MRVTELLDKIDGRRWAERDHLVITKLEYLSTIKYSWSFHNKAGGSFSNSGLHRSLKACCKHAHANTHTNNNWDIPVRLVTVHGFDTEDRPVETVHETYLGKLCECNNKGDAK